MLKTKTTFKITNLSTRESDVLTSDEFQEQWPDMYVLMVTDGILMLKRTFTFGPEMYLFEKSVKKLPICQRCGAVAIVEVSGRTGDLCYMKHLHQTHDGHVLRDMGVGADDHLEFDFCVECGQIQGEFPKRIHGRIVTKQTEGYPYK